MLSPVLAGRVVDAIVERRRSDSGRHARRHHRRGRRCRGGIGLLERLQSSRLGENLILDLRRQVFAHVQRMPIAFFTRTHTGALVSRLNNDVIGTQRAFTTGLAGVVTNVIVLVLTLMVMVRLSWQITCCRSCCSRVRDPGATGGQAGRGAGPRGDAARRRDDLADDRAVLGAWRDLVKLFGRPDEEEAEFGPRGPGVRDIGVKSAIAMEVFFRALMLVSSLALALVYGLGGSLALDR